MKFNYAILLATASALRLTDTNTDISLRAIAIHKNIPAGVDEKFDTAQRLTDVPPLPVEKKGGEELRLPIPERKEMAADPIPEDARRAGLNENGDQKMKDG